LKDRYPPIQKIVSRIQLEFAQSEGGWDGLVVVFQKSTLEPRYEQTNDHCTFPQKNIDFFGGWDGGLQNNYN
jgi:hypothetical protein